MIKKELPGESLNASLTFFQESVPYNLEAEQSLLGALLLDNTLLEKVSEFLKADHFADAFHGHLFGAICRLVERGQIADPITLKDYFAQEKALEAVGGVKYLLDLTQGVLSFTSLEDYGRLIHDLYLRREILRIAREMGEKARVYQLDESAFTHIESAEKELFDLATKGQRQGGFIPFSDALSQALSSTEQAFKKDSHIVGVTSGLLDLDRHLGGFHPSDLLIIAGRPAMGKTSLATNIAFNAANTLLSKKSNGASVAFFSLEMSAEQLAGRILASEAGISSDKMRRGEISTTDFPRFVEVSRRLNQLPLYIDDTPALSVQALRNRARRLQRQQGLDLIIIDYLQLLESGKGGKGDNRVHEISDISRSLKAIAK